MADEALVVGEDGVARCGWGSSPDIYIHYHDTEWGRTTVDERTLFEKLCLEGFQSGLSWLTILRKRPNFREAFDNFDAETVAAFDDGDVARLLGDEGIIRHRGKIEATINNAQCLLDMHVAGETLAGLIWSTEDPARDDVGRPGPQSFSDVPAITEASTSLSKQLKKRGFTFVGPTTAYAALQAMGIVNDHIEGCASRQPCAELRLDRAGAIADLTAAYRQ